MATIYAIHAPEADHLARVVVEMRKLGAPTIRVVDCGDHYQALEGSHRLAACQTLGIEPELDVLGQDDAVDPSEYGLDDNDYIGIKTAGELAGAVFSARDAVPYMFEAP